MAARSLAFATASRAVADGAWLAVVGVDGFGVEAAIEHGIAAERIVQIPAAGPVEWVERLAVAADGFEVLLTCPPRGADRQMRKLRQRLQARGSVLLVVPPIDGRVAPVGADIDLATDEVVGRHRAGQRSAPRPARHHRGIRPTHAPTGRDRLLVAGPRRTGRRRADRRWDHRACG
ncbi:MAG: hypothetical protein R2697_03205 [Ilumatobacteraceae bacterium]